MTEQNRKIGGRGDETNLGGESLTSIPLADVVHDLDLEKVDEYTKKLEDSMLGGDERIHIGPLTLCCDLRNVPPDRVMLEYVKHRVKLQEAMLEHVDSEPRT